MTAPGPLSLTYLVLTVGLGIPDFCGVDTLGLVPARSPDLPLPHHGLAPSKTMVLIPL